MLCIVPEAHSVMKIISWSVLTHTFVGSTLAEQLKHILEIPLHTGHAPHAPHLPVRAWHPGQMQKWMAVIPTQNTMETVQWSLREDTQFVVRFCGTEM